MPNEIDVVRAMVRAKISRVGIWTNGVQGNCRLHKTIAFPDTRFNVGWKKGDGWSGCAQCILTCCAILEDPDMPIESEELVKPVNLAWVLVPVAAAMTVSFTLGALLL